VPKIAYFRPHFLVWQSFFSPKTLSKIAISTPQNAHFRPFSRAHKPTTIHNTLIPSHLQNIQNSLIYGQTVTKSQEVSSREGICKDYSKMFVE
jgi:hypothetical protein